MKKQYRVSIVSLLAITLGTAIYAFGFVNFNMYNHLAEGGLSGITLILHYWFGFNPAYSSLLLNIPLLFIGANFFGKRAFLLTTYGTIMLSVFIAIFQKISFKIEVGDDLLIAGLCAGLCAGLGLGLVFRLGGTTGGTDIVARLIEHYTGIQIGQSLLLIDGFVLFISLSYVDIRHMVYTLIASFVMSQVVNLVENGGYSLRGMIIITKYPEKVSETILYEINRGATYIKAKGAFSKQEKDMLYVVLTPQELGYIKKVLSEVDPEAFVSILNIHEVSGEGFTWAIQNQRKLKFKERGKHD